MISHYTSGLKNSERLGPHFMEARWTSTGNETSTESRRNALNDRECPIRVVDTCKHPTVGERKVSDSRLDLARLKPP